jgi:hypothetical protein
VALATAACLAAPGVAAAQSFAPYWDDPAVTDEAAGTRPVQWHAGLKLGPYLPAIDAQLDGATPYADMFRGGKIMGLFDLDRVIWRPAVGQLAVGGSVGFFGDKATAYLGEGGTTGDPARPRATGDKTAIRIVPMMATAAFRLTVLDDRWGVPVVPYVRGGLGYYAWWITAPDGDAAVDYGDCDPAVAACDGDTARGASLGLVASAGLAIRAERIDRTAQASMQGSGLRHAGFYGELSLGWVDGFGSARKLAVGDTTWFAGIDFEF